MTCSQCHLGFGEDDLKFFEEHLFLCRLPVFLHRCGFKVEQPPLVVARYSTPKPEEEAEQAPCSKFELAEQRLNEGTGKLSRVCKCGKYARDHKLRTTDQAYADIIKKEAKELLDFWVATGFQHAGSPPSFCSCHWAAGLPWSRSDLKPLEKGKSYFWWVDRATCYKGLWVSSPYINGQEDRVHPLEDDPVRPPRGMTYDRMLVELREFAKFVKETADIITGKAPCLQSDQCRCPKHGETVIQRDER
jgi:hypothetical protein